MAATELVFNTDTSKHEVLIRSLRNHRFQHDDLNLNTADSQEQDYLFARVASCHNIVGARVCFKTTCYQPTDRLAFCPPCELILSIILKRTTEV